MNTKTIKASIGNYHFDMPVETARKVKDLQKWIKKKREQAQRYHTIVGSPDVVRSMAKSFRDKKQSYQVVRIDFKNFNPHWNGKRGLGLRITHQVYCSLF